MCARARLRHGTHLELAERLLTDALMRDKFNCEALCAQAGMR
jgi:hypothetical protein